MVHAYVTLTAYLWKKTGLPVIIADEPLTCVARGGGKALEMISTSSVDFLLKE